MSYLEAGVLVEADDSEDDKACSNGERKSDHGKLAVVSCEEPGTMAIDVHKQSSMNSHSRASHFLLQPCSDSLRPRTDNGRGFNYESESELFVNPLSSSCIW